MVFLDMKSTVRVPGTPDDAALGPNGMGQTELYMSKNVISSRLVQFGDISEKSKILHFFTPRDRPPPLLPTPTVDTGSQKVGAHKPPNNH